METKTGAIPIRMVIAMIALTKPAITAFRLPRWSLPRLTRRRRQTTMDLINSSAHLRRDIGLVEENIPSRGR